jgi:hypothetical protein
MPDQRKTGREEPQRLIDDEERIHSVADEEDDFDDDEEDFDDSDPEDEEPA